MASEKAIEAALSAIGYFHSDSNYQKMRAALDAAAAVDGDAQWNVIRDAFRQGFWAWNGASNDAEVDRDTAMEQEAWNDYADICSLKRD